MGRPGRLPQGIDKNKTKENSPNVLFILMDDLGYGDISANGAIYDTPNIDRIGEEGAQFTNFYSSYSVCSPARFAALTGRYPYRGYADNVIYPTVDTFSPFASTRIFNSVEMGGNADGMLGDEITIAEAQGSGLRNRLLRQVASRRLRRVPADQSGLRLFLRQPLCQRYESVLPCP